MKTWFQKMKRLPAFLRENKLLVPVLVVLLGPMLLSLLLGAEFIHLPFQKVPTVIVNHDDSATTQNLIQMIDDNRTFDVVACTDSEDELKQAFYYNTALAGIVIPAGFSEDLLNGKSAQIMIFNDGALSTVASGMRSTIASALGTIQSGFLMQLAEGKGIPPAQAMSLIAPFQYTTEVISNPTSNIAYMMMEGVLLTMVQIAACGAGACITERKNRKTLLQLVSIITAAASLAALVVMLTQTYLYGFPFKSGPLAGILMTIFTCWGITMFGVLMNLKSKGNADEASENISLVSFSMLIAGYTFPVISMPKPLQPLAWFMPNAHYINPLRDMALSERSFMSEAHHVVWLFVFACLMTVIVLRQCKKVAEKQEASAAGLAEGGKEASAL